MGAIVLLFFFSSSPGWAAGPGRSSHFLYIPARRERHCIIMNNLTYPPPIHSPLHSSLYSFKLMTVLCVCVCVCVCCTAEQQQHTRTPTVKKKKEKEKETKRKNLRGSVLRPGSVLPSHLPHSEERILLLHPPHNRPPLFIVVGLSKVDSFPAPAPLPITRTTTIMSICLLQTYLSSISRIYCLFILINKTLRCISMPDSS